MGKTLFDKSEGNDNNIQFETNEKYSQHYKKTRARELLQKYGGLKNCESDSDSYSETSEEEVDAKFDEEFFKTLAFLKGKEPHVDIKDKQFFDTVNIERAKRTKDKPINVRDYERELLLTKGNYFEEKEATEQFNRLESPPIVEETEKLRNEFKKLVHDEDDVKNDSFGGIFNKREKSKEQQDTDETDYVKWLAGHSEHVQTETKKELEPLKKYWNSNELSNEERFLRNYILTKGYSDSTESQIPTYEDVVGEKRISLSEDEAELQKQELFEHKYNLRFEESETDFIKRYPRTLENTVRLTNNTRKEKRNQLKERKKLEKVQKMKELEVLKKTKREEIEERIRKIKAVTGNEELAVRSDELDEDFDPEAHDRRMQELFNDNYYAVDEGEEKPNCPSDIEELKVEDWDEYDPAADDAKDAGQGPDCEREASINYESDPQLTKKYLQQELIANTRRSKGRRGKNKFLEVLRADKPCFDPKDEKTYAEYIDEYYKLDCEDFIGDLPCRFKYVETTPNDFGLSIEEILLAKNKELNRWASLKKAIQIRPEAIEKKEARMYRLKAKNEELKRKIFKSIYGEESDSEDSFKAVEKKSVNKAPKNAVQTQETDNQSTMNNSQKKLKKRKTQAKITTTDTNDAEVIEKEKETERKQQEMPDRLNANTGKVVKNPTIKNQKARKFNAFKRSSELLNPNKKYRADSSNASTEISAERFKAYGISLRKFHKRQKFGNKQFQT